MFKKTIFYLPKWATIFELIELILEDDVIIEDVIKFAPELRNKHDVFSCLRVSFFSIVPPVATRPHAA